MVYFYNVNNDHMSVQSSVNSLKDRRWITILLSLQGLGYLHSDTFHDCSWSLSKDYETWKFIRPIFRRLNESFPNPGIEDQALEIRIIGLLAVEQESKRYKFEDK